jgi:MFS-type transporter involved in bile tolerance (Atg22 family)
VIPLISISLTYLLAVYLGSRSEKLGPRRMAVITVLTLVQVLVVMIVMFVMDPPVFKRFGE